MSGRRSGPGGNLAPPSPSPAREAGCDGVDAEGASEAGMLSMERPIASDAASARSTPNANAVTAAAPVTENDAPTPPPQRAAEPAAAKSSTASSIESQRRSASTHESRGEEDVRMLSDVPPPLSSGPPQRQHSGMSGPAPAHKKSPPSEALVKSTHGSPSRPQSDSRLSSAGDDADRTRHMSINVDSAEVAKQNDGTAARTRVSSSTGKPQSSTVGFIESSPEAKRQESIEKRPLSNASVSRMYLGESPMVDAVYAAAARTSRYASTAQHKARSESYLYDSHLYPSTSSASAAGINNSGYTTSQRALVQYGSSPVDIDAPAYAYRESVAAASEGGYSPSRHAEIRAMLISAERELAEMRDECAKRGLRAEALEAALDRERANIRTLRDRFADEAAATREEHESVTRQLRDQLHVLKMVSESAMADKSKMAEEAGRRKKELLSLLDREREEKSYIMADYREQTESLIEEQGREITSLRAALDKMKEDFDGVAKQYRAADDEREALVEKLEVLSSQLDRERTEASSRIRDLQAAMEQECAALREQLETRTEQVQRASAGQLRKQQDLADQLQKSEERQRVSEEQHQHAIEALKHAYRRDTDSLREELQRLKESRDKQEEELRREADKATKREAKSAEGLRQALEQARKEKEACVDESYQQRETLQRQHREKVATLQSEIDALALQLAEERAARKDCEADAEVLRVRAESLDKANHRLSNELETSQAEQRSRERAAEQAHQTVVEELRGKVRSTTTDLGYAQDQLAQSAVDAQQLRDELARRSTALDAAKEKLARQEIKLSEEVTKVKDSAALREREMTQLLSQMRVSKTQAEATCERLERQLKDAEGRVQGTSRQAEEERRSLEDALRKLQDSRVELEDLRAVVAHAQERSASALEEKRQLEQQLEDAQLFRGEAENALRNGERKMLEQQQELTRQQKQTEGRLEEQAQRHHAELAAARMAAEQVRGEVARARETLVMKESALQQLREEVGKLHRDAAIREEGLREDMEDLREAHEMEMRRMDELMNGLRSDLGKSQAMCTQYQHDLSHMHRNSEGERSDLGLALEQAVAARAKLLEDAKYRDQLNRELQGTVRLLSSRLTANEEEVRRVQEELADTNRRIQDAHTLIGRKDAAIGQLNAKLRAYEARLGTGIAS